MRKQVLSVIVLLFLAVFPVTTAFGAVLPVFSHSAAASGSGNCPSSQTVTFVTEPIPQSFNMLAPSGDSTFMVASLQYLSLAPFTLEPNGGLDWNDSLSNWITTNSNYTVWTFHIRPGATWSNGTAVTAQDVVTWLSPAYALNPDYDFVNLHNEVVGVRAVNSDTVQINLNSSDAQLPNRIGEWYYAPVVSPSDVSKGPSDPLFGTSVADGPWSLSNYQSGQTA
ncbi:MAG: ABC transporter substrate-binding protein, partial [Thaumarchaeota archaeon]|nr:ABC transporter substrate-binding protein [Nitrososphaerota archaeon]